MGGGYGPQKINLNSPSGIIHGHLIVLVRHKQAQMCLQNDLNRYEKISTKFKKYFFLFQQIFYCLTHSLIHYSLMRSFKCSGKLATATASGISWRKTVYYIKYPLFSQSFSFDPSLWWSLLLSMAALKGHARFHTLCQASRIT